jgi:gamma-glutamyl hydrolase
MKKLLSFILVSCVLSLRLKHRYPPQNPVIGIYTQAHDEDNNLNTNTTYIAASYVKFIEMSGAQVVPIYSFSETRQVLNLMEKVNGVLFTGGGLKKFDISDQWTKNAEAILNFAKTQNDNNNPFPIFGTCQGLELLCYLTSNYNHSILA